MRKISRQKVGRTDGALGCLSRFKGLTRILGGILFLALLLNPGQALSLTLPGLNNVTLAWSASPSTEVTGYRLYYGTASSTYTVSVVLGNVTTNTVTDLVGGVTYFFAVTAHDANEVESEFSNEISYTVPMNADLPTIVLTSPLDGVIDPAPATFSLTAGVTANGHTIARVQFYNGTTLLGEVTSAPYSLIWTNVSAGSYDLTAQLVYDSGSTLASTSASVTVTPTLTPTVTTVQIHAAPDGLFILTVTGQVGYTYDLEATEDFTAWTMIATVTLGASGSLDFTDTNAASFPRRFYRTQQKP